MSHPLRRTALVLVLPLVAALGVTTGAHASGHPNSSHSAPSHSGHGHGVHDRVGTRTTVVVSRSAGGQHTIAWSGRGRHFVQVSSDPDAHVWREVGSSTSGTLVVPGLDAGTRWYFRVAADRSGRGGVVSAARAVGLTSAPNTRDLGGYRTSDGRTVAWGQVFRAEAITRPTEADQRLVESLGLKTSVDFRSDGEVAQSGANRLSAQTRVVRAPLLDASTEALAVAISGALSSGDPVALEQALGGGRAEQIALEGPAQMVVQDVAQREFAATFDRLSDPAQRPLAYNCSAGKDRTGIFSALVLRALGVSEATITEDYVASNVHRGAYNQRIYATLAAAGMDIELVRPLLEQQPAAITNMFDAIDQTYGSFDRYLRDQLGVSRAQLRTLRQALLR